jgi:hypothetical protein
MLREANGFFPGGWGNGLGAFENPTHYADDLGASETDSDMEKAWL